MHAVSRLLLGLLLLTMCAASFPAVAQDAEPTADTCLARAFKELAREQRLYRVVILGRGRAEDARQSEIRYDTDGDPWIKVSGKPENAEGEGDGEEGEWRTLAAGKEEEVLSDDEMDERLETDPLWDSPLRKGFIEAKQMLTSELLGPIVASSDTLGCRARAVCIAAMASMEEDASDPLTGEVEACLPLETYGYSPFEECAFQNRTELTDAAVVKSSCDEAAELMIQRERDALKGLIAYDTGYRALLLYTGTFNRFTDDFRFSLLRPLWDSLTMLRQISRLPCFLSTCEQ